MQMQFYALYSVPMDNNICLGQRFDFKMILWGKLGQYIDHNM